MAGEQNGKQDETRLTSEIREALHRDLSEGGHAVPEEELRGKIPLFRMDILWRLRPVSMRQIISFTRELSLLIHSGMPLLRSLKALSKRSGNERFRRTVHRISIMVENGSPFWEALASFPHVFSKIYVSTIRAGEVSGRLEPTLNVLAKFYETGYNLHRKIRGAMFYPLVVLAVVIGVIILMSVVVIPVFVSAFEELRIDVPPLTRALINTANFLQQFWYLFLIIAGFFIASYYLLNRVIAGQLLIDRLKLKMPIFGPIHLRMVISRFTRTLGILLQSGVSILEALDISAETCGNEIVAKKLDEIRQGIEKGETLESCLAEPGIFPPLLTDMLIVGEEAGALENVLDNVAAVYEEETSDVVSNLTTVAEPVLIIAMGFLVAFVFSSLFVPYIKLVAAIGGA